MHDSETPAHGQQVITAVAIIHAIMDGHTKVFLPKRAKTKKFLPDVYELPGGHIDFGEDIEVGLKREIREEFNKEIILGDVVGAFTYTNEVKGSHSVEIIYLAEFKGSIDDITLQPEDHSEYIWAAEDELAKAYAGQKGSDDKEFQYVRKAFKVLG